MTVEIITDREIYTKVIQGMVPRVEKFLWIGTSDIKDLHVNRGRGMVPFLKILAELLDKDVRIRLIHAKEPGERFRTDFDRYPQLIDGLERMLCPRVHFKCVIADGKTVYTGSGNLTGAGMGAKGDNTRNFETGLISDDPEMVEKVMKQFDSVWMGKHCKKCRRKEYCAEFTDMKN